jgi:hypothetical protein
MAISTAHLEKVGTTFAGLWEERDLDVIGPLYHEDAVFISPNPPNFSSDFSTTLQGRDEILRYLRTTLEVIPSGVVTTTGLFTGINMVVWVWGVGADVMLFDDDGLIVRHHVTEGNVPPDLSRDPSDAT